MKGFAYVAATLLVLGVATASHAQAVHHFEFNFDENGNATFLDPLGSTSQWYTAGTTAGTGTFTFSTDPTGSVAGNVLIYHLPELVRSGAVDVAEFGGGISDTLFFTNTAGINDSGIDADLMVFYSQPGGIDLADTGLPAFAGSLTSVATEDVNGNFTWLPDGPTFPDGNEYNGISPEEAPEPGSLAMALTGAVGALGIFVRRSVTRA